MSDFPLRIALYSHDAMGLGHARRNLLIAKALLTERSRAILMITGASEAGALGLPYGVDCLALPALAKSLTGAYRPRSLGVSLEELMRLRAETILAALESFQPDVLVVDKKPLGVLRELEPSIERLGRRGATRLVLGLRDVLDAPETVRRQWCEEDSEAAIRDRYDAVWVYGDPIVYDAVAEYGLSREVAAKVRYTGYLDGRGAASAPAGSRSHDLMDTLALPPGRIALCLLGGGQDGFRVADAFARAKLPADASAVIVTGPFMPEEQREHLRQRATGRNLRVLQFVEDLAPMLARAHWVVAMGGYNTVCELLACKKRALTVPRAEPRSEQLIRAERMRELDLLDLLHPAELSARAVSEWLEREPRPPGRVLDGVDFGGLDRVPILLDELLAGGARGREVAWGAS